MKDVRGKALNIGDEVYIYWGYNQLRPAVIKDIQGKVAKVFCDGTLSKWKRGECMIKAEEPTGYYPDEVILLLEEIRRLRDEALMNKEGLPTKQLCQGLLNFWDMKRPMKLVTS